VKLKGVETLWKKLYGTVEVVVASSILGTALTIYEGKYAFSIPSFGGQRRGAPLIALTRISEIPIRKRHLKADPDYIVILDDSLASVAVADLGDEKPRYIIVNSKKSAADLGLTKWQHLTIVDAEAIAMEVIGRPITNTVMIGAFAAATGVVQLDAVKKATADVVAPGIAKKNVAAVEAGFKGVRR